MNGLGVVSRDNPTGTSRNLTRFLGDAAIARSDTVLWNAVPWIVHEPGARNRPLRRGEIADGLALLPLFLALLPRLAVVILAGRVAGEARATVAAARPDVAVLAMPHPSPTFVCTSPEVPRRIERALGGGEALERAGVSGDTEPQAAREGAGLASVEITGLCKRFGDATVLHPTDLAIDDGEFLVIVGPSGCGKSTLLRLIAGLEEPSGGAVAIGGRDVTHAAPAERGVAMVFQSYALYPHLSVAENIAFPLRVARRPRAEIDARVAAVAASLDLTPLLARRPRALSGGQRQRVSIARAIVREPAVLLLDEPLSNLDAELRVRMRHEFARLHQTLGATMIYVTHDQLEAMTLANRIVVMSAGVVQQVGAPLDLYRAPANLAVATAIGSPGMNLVPVTILAADAEGARVRLPDGGEAKVAARVPAAPVGSAATLGVRPEHLHLADDGPFAGPVELFERLGPLSFAHLGARGEAGTVVAQLPGDRRVALGEMLRVGAAAADMHLFDAEGRACAPLRAYGHPPTG